MAIQFIIYQNEFLKTNTIGYYSVYYTGYGSPDNPEYLNTLKNTFNNEKKYSKKLNEAKDTVVEMLVEELPQIIEENDIESCTVVCIPRAKNIDSYTNEQLYFSKAVSEAVAMLGDSVVDGVGVIRRHTNTKTTHLRSDTGRKYKDGEIIRDTNVNDGAEPYPGITKDTCHFFDTDKIRDKDVILIDDIYTRNVNIDEDAIQALYKLGARRVFFYAVALTRRWE